MTSTIAQINEVIKTSQAILSSPTALAIRFAGNMKHLLNVVYAKRPVQFNPLDVATTILPYVSVDNAGKGHIKFSKSKVTWGDLPNAERITAYAVEGGIRFSWHDNTGMGDAKADDHSVLIAYSLTRKQFRFTAVGPDRQTGQGMLALPDMRGQQVYTWLSFLAADGSNVADSIYTGCIQVL